MKKIYLKEYIIKQIFYSNYIPFYLDNGVERNYKLLNNLLKNVLIYEYEFLPEKKSVHYLADFCENIFKNLIHKKGDERCRMS